MKFAKKKIYHGGTENTEKRFSDRLLKAGSGSFREPDFRVTLAALAPSTHAGCQRGTPLRGYYLLPLRGSLIV